MLVRLTLAALLATGLAVAQPGGGQMGEGMGGSRGGSDGMGRGDFSPGGAVPRRQSKLDIFADKLKLKSDQKSQVESIFSAANEKAVPVRDQLSKGRQVIAQAMLAKAGDDDVKKLLADYATVSAQMTGIEADAFAKVYALLKPNQQAKAAQAFELMAGMFYPMGGGGRMGGGRGNREGGR